MIGVIVQAAERPLVAELFELLKTPWEFWRAGCHYDVLLSTSDELPSKDAALTVVFSGEILLMDAEHGTGGTCGIGGMVVSPEGQRFPIYGSLRTFSPQTDAFLSDEATGLPVAYIAESEHGATLRVGYNLLEELRILLTRGQPVENAGVPTMEEHLAILREWITRSGIPLVEIPPAPHGYPFIACLTHDIDHPSLRNHWCDHTMVGFLYRATVGTLLDVCKTRRPVSVLWKNLRAAGMLPFVHLGVAEDSWSKFPRYSEIEGGRGGTYFVIPRRNDPGRTHEGQGPAHRASAYGVSDLLPQLHQIVADGGEVAVHGLDSWLDAEAGRSEREQVEQAVPASEAGVRMHWLYFDENSAAHLEEAGYSYDSTFGYCETIGYRAGTMQVFRPPGRHRLLELPLHIMDTALFYPCYLNLDENEAGQMLAAILDDAVKFGGALTVNWHDRSLFPERCWDGFYCTLVRDLKANGAWLPTASQAVAWFNKRRSAVIGPVERSQGSLKVRASVEEPDSLPDLRLRIHKPRSPSLRTPKATRQPAQFVDIRIDRTAEATISI